MISEGIFFFWQLHIYFLGNLHERENKIKNKIFVKLQTDFLTTEQSDDVN